VRVWWWARRAGGLTDARWLGFVGEDLAARHLRRAGLRVRGRNVVTAHGEADLVCWDPGVGMGGGAWVVVEVKTRRVRGRAVGGGDRPFPPEAAVDRAKRQRLARIARALAAANGWGTTPTRVDVVAIDWPEEGEPAIRHWRDVGA